MRHSSEESERGNAIVEFVGVMAVLVVPAVIALLAGHPLCSRGNRPDRRGAR